MNYLYTVYTMVNHAWPCPKETKHWNLYVIVFSINISHKSVQPLYSLTNMFILEQTHHQCCPESIGTSGECPINQHVVVNAALEVFETYHKFSIYCRLRQVKSWVHPIFLKYPYRLCYFIIIPISLAVLYRTVVGFCIPLRSYIVYSRLGQQDTCTVLYICT